MANTVGAPVGCRQSVDLPALCPDRAMGGTQFDGTEFIEADHMGVFATMLIVPLYSFFLASKSSLKNGDLDVRYNIFSMWEACSTEGWR